MLLKDDTDIRTEANLKEAQLLNSGVPVPTDASSVVSFKTEGSDEAVSASASLPQDDPWEVFTGPTGNATLASN